MDEAAVAARGGLTHTPIALVETVETASNLATYVFPPEAAQATSRCLWSEVPA
ncbi:MAG: hypothetical protein IPH07_39900 [Deltaproteobacteria bacterium]|nr:hypothetical protein [Deltaproteobacteria bacterium]MBK8713995.1 hypothetical protein [Deltaproteobacteria bacterium]MBP7291167.1 hypothetical protein [Nannocystaceae bacterium]